MILKILLKVGAIIKAIEAKVISVPFQVLGHDSYELNLIKVSDYLRSDILYTAKQSRGLISISAV